MHQALSCKGMAATRPAAQSAPVAKPGMVAPVKARMPTRLAAVRLLRCKAASVIQEVDASVASNGAGAASQLASLPASAASVAERFHGLSDPKQRLKLLLEYARSLPALPEDERRPENRVMGCTAQAWVSATLDPAGHVSFSAASDSDLTAGLAGVLAAALSGLPPQQVLDFDAATFLQALNLGPAVLAPSRANGFANMLEAMRRRARMLVTELPRFPSLLIGPDSAVPQGAFAEAQARYLTPDPARVDRLVDLFSTKHIGVVAHFYMDPEVQGVLASAAERWPHIHISDSLVMADRAVAMAKAGCKAIAVLGVDFMSENVRAILDEAGYKDVGVYRMAADDIGCSLAEAAESDAYIRYLDAAAQQARSLHVVYINTSLRTKALAIERVATITCTSSNVVQTVLQAFAQVPDLHVFYGPDTYMGANLAQLFTNLAQMPDEEVAALHPGHTAASVASLLPRLHYFQEGTCIVHHIFGGEVCELVKQGYSDAYLTAHFEVPGEMFTLAMAAKARGMGTVGSTSNILDFITAKLDAALAQPHSERLRFVLGTEAGMITSIVRAVQQRLRGSKRTDVDVEIVFPVAPQAISTPQQARAEGSAPLQLPGGISILPGPASGEGCSLEGGCAACPYMKMNTLAALESIAQKVGSAAGEALLAPFAPRPYADILPSGRSIASAGCVPILHMRHFSQAKDLSAELVADIESRGSAVKAEPALATAAA